MATNPQLKKAYAEAEYTAENILHMKKCMKDPIYFMTNFIKVQHPTKGAVPFELYDYQVEMVKGIHENKDSIILASRQLGKCSFAPTMLNTVRKPVGFRSHLLKLLDRETYDALCTPKPDDK